jgi:hypothetical protein
VPYFAADHLFIYFVIITNDSSGSYVSLASCPLLVYTIFEFRLTLERERERERESLCFS